MTLTEPSSVTAIPAADPAVARAHFAARLAFETDCADVHAALKSGNPDFVLLDVRGPSAYARGHVPGALNLSHRDMTEARLSVYPKETLFVVYCAGPHCNGADRGALRLSDLGRRVKLMLGGLTGWQDEGFSVVAGTEPRRL
jgi:rhodanese-related sulfurtransferase